MGNWKAEWMRPAFQPIGKRMWRILPNRYRYQGPRLCVYFKNVRTLWFAKVSNIDDFACFSWLNGQRRICQPIAEEEDGYSSLLCKNSLLVFNENTSSRRSLRNFTNGCCQTNHLYFIKTDGRTVSWRTAVSKMQIKRGTLTSLLQWMLFLRYILYNKSIMGLSSQLDLSEVMAVRQSQREGKIALQIETYSDNTETDALLKETQAQAVKN